MTAPARIQPREMAEAVKVASAYERARVIFDFANQRIEVIIGEPVNDPADTDKWTDDNV